MKALAHTQWINGPSLSLRNKASALVREHLLMTTCASLAVFSDYRYVCFLLAELVEDGGGVSASCENPDRPNHMGKPFSQHFFKKNLTSLFLFYRDP